MAGTRTAPTVGALTINKSDVTLHLVDGAGDITTDNVTSVDAPDLADVETHAAAYQATTQASLYKVSLTQEWVGDLDPQNAESDLRYSIANGINLLWKNQTTLATETPRLYAPIPAVMQGNQDIPLLSPAVMVSLIASYQALLTGYGLNSAQYTTRRERRNNPRIRV